MSSPARADTLRSARGEPVLEVGHQVHVEVEPGLARLRVRRTFENRGALADQVEMDLLLPAGAAATGLRIRGRDRWYEGLLMEANMAAVVYESLTGFGPWRVKDPALLFWTDLGELGLMVFPVLPGARSTVEYSLLVPLTYRDGRYAFDYPAGRDQPELAVPELELGRGLRPDEVQVNGKAVNGQARISLKVGDASDPTAADDQGEALGLESLQDLLDAEWALDEEGLEPGQGLAHVSLPTPPIDLLQARYSTFRIAPGRELYRLEIDVARELRPAPRRASVVFVIDASRSFGEEAVTAALELCRAYAAHLGDARFQVVLFRRQAAPLLDRFVKARDLDAALDRAQARDELEPGNGSFLERGLERAARLLAGRRAPWRVVVVTDARMRERFSNGLATQALARVADRAIVHLVELTPGSAGDPAELRRDDEHALAQVALGHGGMAVHLSEGAMASDYSSAALELVRPLRLHDFRITSHEEPLLPGTEAFDLPAGVGLRSMDIRDRAPAFVALQGKLWAEPVVRIVAADPEHGGEVLPALLFGSSLYQGLEPAEMMRAAVAGKAVSPVTSYLSVEPGTRPSTDGFLEEGGSGGFGSGAGGLGLRGSGAGGGGAAQLRLDQLLRALAQRAAASCFDPTEPGQWVEVHLECTLDEIVDLEVQPSGDAELDRCVAEALWEIRLPRAFSLERFEASFAVAPTSRAE